MKFKWNIFQSYAKLQEMLNMLARSFATFQPFRVLPFSIFHAWPKQNPGMMIPKSS